MNIRIEKNTDRRFAYTDRRNGYLDLSAGTVATGSQGYFRGTKKLLADFFVSTGSSSSTGNADFWRTNALYTDVSPEGFSLVFEQQDTLLSLDVSLLLDEQSFYLALRDVPEIELDALNTALPAISNSDNGIGILLSSSLSSHWIKTIEEGICLYQNGIGTAVASATEFQLESDGPDRIILFSDDCFSSCYLVFEENQMTAKKKALRLAATCAIKEHRQKIESFFSLCESCSGDSRFDDAVRWALFSGWLLVNNENGNGIWAGLPWFRETWGRDTCIALTGILLVSGRFAEARSVLSSFASLQNRNVDSFEYGLLPNRYRNEYDLIFNCADSTLWFIRSLWEYVQYSGDIAIFNEMKETIDIALESNITRRIDSRGFYLHEDFSTWMHAQIDGCESWSPRGDRACEIQSLWYTALQIGSRIAHLQGDEKKAEERNDLSQKVKESFRKYFWSTERNALADHLPPGLQGELMRDFRVRPNQLFAITAPSLLENGDNKESSLLDSAVRMQILENVTRELVSPLGLFSLSPDDPLFHREHENESLYHNDAAYHNGTIGVWNTGAYVSATANHTIGVLSSLSSSLLRNQADLILDDGCVGTLCGSISALCRNTGRPILSGSWSQAWSVSEFCRNVYQDIIGFQPRLAENRIELHPHLLDGMNRWCAELSFGNGWHLSIELEKKDTGVEFSHGAATVHSPIHCHLLWKVDSSEEKKTLPLLSVNGVPIEEGQPLDLFLPDSTVPRTSTYTLSKFPRHEMENEWCASFQQKDYLEKLLLSGRMKKTGGGCANSVALEWYFDSSYFSKKYNTNLPMGALWSPGKTIFRVWSPTARAVRLVLYTDGSDSSRSMAMVMKAGSLQTGNAGVWELPVAGDQSGVYYTYSIESHGIIREAADPYAHACGVNGKRSMVVAMELTNPAGWSKLRAPKVSSINDVVLYEVHVADISSSYSWNGEKSHKRTYLGAAESGTSFFAVPTGYDHIKSLGVTHIQLMPVFDFGSVDEKRLDDEDYRDQVVGGNFNWGYDPENYSSPEGSYSTNPSDGAVRIRELKTMIGEYIKCGIGVIMDVVYNHVPTAQNHSLGISLNGYYFRVDSYSGAGDDTASEREMFRSYMIDSLSFWLHEYKLSGFRFDLMGLHDVETMNAIVTALRKIKSDVLIYGEGWDMYRGGKMIGASMIEAHKMNGVSFFNDAFRCGIKGSVFNAQEGGFIHTGTHRESVKFGLVGAVYHPQVHNRNVDGTANPNPWTNRTGTSVNYTEIHDNATLYDKLILVESGETEEYYERLQKTAISLVLLAQGVPVIHAGMEFMRTKEIPTDLLNSNPDLHDLYWTVDHTRAFSHNSYNVCDRINALDWTRCAGKQHIVEYVRRLIAVRKAHPLFRLRTADEVSSFISFLEPETEPSLPLVIQETQQASITPVEPSVLAWKIDGKSSVDSWQSVCIVVNPSRKTACFSLPPCSTEGLWHLITDGEYFAEETDTKTLLEKKEPSPVSGDTVVTIDGKALYLYAEF